VDRPLLFPLSLRPWVIVFRSPSRRISRRPPAEKMRLSRRKNYG